MRRSTNIFPKHFPSLTFFLLLFPVSIVLAQEEYSFDMSAYEKSPFEFNGYAEFRWEHMQLDKDTTIYQLNYYNQEQADNLDRYTGSLQLEAKYKQDDLSLYVRINPESYDDDYGHDTELNTHEAYLSWRAKPSLTVDLGKKLMKWGKGYAWNPVGFIERPKDPNEPDLAREGFTTLSGDWIISRPGDLQTIAITPVYLPVNDDMNNDFGPEDDNFAARIYFLYRDTDIDLMFLSKGSRTARYGLDFSRNISTNFELHAEWAYITDLQRRILDTANNLVSDTDNIQTWLLGLRYLTESDTTYIVEYFYNEGGFTEQQLRTFYQLIDDVPNQPDPDLAMAYARSIARSGYLKQTMMQKYLYFRAMQKEPFDWLYVTPAITAIINVQDQSYNIAPEIIYDGISNLELRAKLNYLEGDKYTEFGEKQNDSKFELRARYFF